MDRYIGKRLEGRYDILELIGKGGMANVYRAYDTIDNRTVAVKVLRDEFLDNEEFLRRFKNESKAIALLNHPNIVRVYDVSFGDIQSIVMEYIDGVTLKEYIDHTGPLPWKDAVHFAIQVLHALQHAHDKGIVHRDVKPQNIMLLSTGEIKVTDFGIARFARSESRTISDRAIGSVHYISPEQAMGQYTDDKTDLYSTGIMLFEMITGQLPFEADTAISVAMKQIQMPIKRPRAVNPSIPIGLEEIILKSVQKDAEDRYQSAAEMIDALEQFREHPDRRFNYTYRSLEGPKNEQTSAQKPSAQRRKNMKKQPQKQSTKRRSSYLRMMMIVTLAVVLGSAGFVGLMVYLNNPFEKTPDATVPNLLGDNVHQVVEMHPEFTFEEQPREYSDEHNKDIVYDQRPKPGHNVKIGSTIKVWVSDGKKEVVIPDITDTPAARVTSQLIDLGLQTEVVRVNHESISAGRVINTEPGAGTTVGGGDKITIYISEGPEKKLVTVPDVSNMTEESARRALEQQLFQVGQVSEDTSDMPAGTVIRQDPVGGSLVPQDTVVNLVISKEGMSRYYINVPLPSGINRDVTIRARVGEGDNPAVAAEEVLNPAQHETGVWTPSFSGEEDEVLKIIIYVDGRLYQEYYLDFYDGNHTVIRDRSDASEFQE